MKRAVVTGAAGFIGSHLSERLSPRATSVAGIDALHRLLRPRRQASRTSARSTARRASTSSRATSTTSTSRRCWRTAPVVFHLAAQPGVRLSFGEGFARYTADNMLATQRVLEAAAAADCPRVVWASSSSVYGDAAAYPCIEAETPTAPRSPYGVTKRACEDLAAVYGNGGLSTVGLRYFTVYGPRQRPDMAMRKLCEALLDGASFPLYGDGSQSRDFTHVADAVDATFRAGLAARPGAHLQRRRRPRGHARRGHRAPRGPRRTPGRARPPAGAGGRRQAHGGGHDACGGGPRLAGRASACARACAASSTGSLRAARRRSPADAISVTIHLVLTSCRHGVQVRPARVSGFELFRDGHPSPRSSSRCSGASRPIPSCAASHGRTGGPRRSGATSGRGRTRTARRPAGPGSRHWAHHRKRSIAGCSAGRRRRGGERAVRRRAGPHRGCRSRGS